VLVEAMGAGKVVVTSANPGWRRRSPPDHAVLFETPVGLGRRSPRRSTASMRCRPARGRVARPLAHATGENLVRHLLAVTAPATAVRRTARKRVLLIMNGDAMVLKNGASQVALAQLRYLTAAGHRRRTVPDVIRRQPRRYCGVPRSLNRSPLPAGAGIHRRPGGSGTSHPSASAPVEGAPPGPSSTLSPASNSAAICCGSCGQPGRRGIAQLHHQLPGGQRPRLEKLPVIWRCTTCSRSSAPSTATGWSPKDLDDEFGGLAALRAVSLNPRETGRTQPRA
jgi:hypothetical protein